MLVFTLLAPDDRQAAHGAPPTGGGDQPAAPFRPARPVSCSLARIFAIGRAHRTD